MQRCCVVLCCVVSCRVVSCCVVSCRVVLRCVVLRCVVLCCVVLHCIAIEFMIWSYGEKHQISAKCFKKKPVQILPSVVLVPPYWPAMCTTNVSDVSSPAGGIANLSNGTKRLEGGHDKVRATEDGLETRSTEEINGRTRS